jgi:preprotein translocase subunit SecD
MLMRRHTPEVTMRRRVGTWVVVIVSTVICSAIAGTRAPRVSAAAAAADDPATDAAAKERDQRLETWRKSPEGRAALEKMTAKSSRLQIRLVLRAGEEGEADELAEASGQKLRVSREILLNETAFASAAKGASPSSGKPIVEAKLNEAGANQMEWVTSRNIGRKLAIVFDGKLLMAPTIRSTIRGALTIDGGTNGFAAGDVERIVDALNNKK